jgi:hypothetical protein
VLTNGPDHTIRGGGNVGGNNLGLVNQGAIVADAPGGMLIDVSDSNSFVNEGLVHVTGDGSLNIANGPMDHHGAVLIDETRTLHRSQNFTQTGGVTTVAGTLEMGGVSVVDLQGGTLEGDGAVAGAVRNSGGDVEPGLSPGTLDVGAYDASPAYCGALSIEMAGDAPDAEYDVLMVGGAADLGGILRVELLDGFMPQIGDEFEVLHAASVDGRFDCVEFPPLVEGYLSVVYGEDVVKVAVVADPPAPPAYADVNADGVVDVLDLLAVLSGWGGCGCGCCPPDVDGDGAVNVLDLLDVLANWS